MRPELVYRILPEARGNYPRLMASHPRNRGIDWLAFAAYAECGRPSEMQVDIFVKATRDFDVVYFGHHFIVSDRLRNVIDPMVGGPVEFLPVHINGRAFWIMRLLHEVDVLDLERSGYRVDGLIRTLDKPVWRGERLADPSIFTVSDLPGQVLATPEVVRAYENSGCDGLLFGVRGEVVWE